MVRRWNYFGHLTAARLLVLALGLNAETQHGDLSGLMRVCSLEEADKITVTYHDKSGSAMKDGDKGSHDSTWVEDGKSRFPEVELACVDPGRHAWRIESFPWLPFTEQTTIPRILPGYNKSLH